MKHRVLITGAAGYVGAMLCRHFSAREDVSHIIGLDKEPMPEFLQNLPKLHYIQRGTWESGWQEEAARLEPDIVVNAAWQIRELYGKKKLQWQMNIEGSNRVFDFACATLSVKRLIDFSTVASYGARSSNTIKHRFTEAEEFRTSEYLYAEEKRIAEERLQEKYTAAKKAGSAIMVAVLRPAAVTGPRGRFMRVRFGLQAALSGQLTGSVLYRFISLLVSFVPVTKNWCRQFIHEDDVVDIVEMLSFNELKSEYDVFNICPPGPVVAGADMARAVGKRMLRVHPYVVRFAFFCMWHLSAGNVPTSRGGWKSYSYPIVVDGSKLTRVYGYPYRASSYDAFYYTNGRYEEYVPTNMRRHRGQ